MKATIGWTAIKIKAVIFPPCKYFVEVTKRDAHHDRNYYQMTISSVRITLDKVHHTR